VVAVVAEVVAEAAAEAVAEGAAVAEVAAVAGGALAARIGRKTLAFAKALAEGRHRRLRLLRIRRSRPYKS